MTSVSCPTAIVAAPIDVVWALLTDPAGWGTFYDIRVTRVHPPGPAAVGQRLEGTSGPRILPLRVTAQFLAIDAVQHRLVIDFRLPLGITVHEDLRCKPINATSCQVNYSCDFGFPAGWRGVLVRFLLQREIVKGPADSLTRLKRAAEALYHYRQTVVPRSGI